MDSNNNIHVLLIDHESQLGGAEHSMVEIVDAMPKDLITYNAAIRGEGEFSKALFKAGINNVFYLPMDGWRWWELGPLNRIKLVLSFPIQMVNILRWFFFFKKQKPDLIHFNLTRLVEPVLAAKLCKIPAVLHFREDLNNNSAFWGGNSSIFKLLNFVEYWIANSKNTFDCIKPFFLGKLITIIPNGLNIEKFKSNKELAKQNFVVLKLAGLVPWKNHELFLKIARAVIHIDDSIKFIIAGKGKEGYKLHLMELCDAYNISNNVSFTGYVSDTVGLINDGNLLLHTSGKETFGRIFIEAMACEKPVIAISGGAANELVFNEFNGFIFENNEIDAIAKRIVELSKAPELCKMIGRNGRSFVIDNYDSKKISLNIYNFYMKILST